MWTYWIASGASIVVMAVVGGVIGRTVHRAKEGKNGSS